MELPDEGTYAFLLPPREIRLVATRSFRLSFPDLSDSLFDYFLEIQTGRRGDH